MFQLENAQSLAGVAVTIGLCWLLSEKRAAFPWKLAIGAVAVQAALVLLLFGLPAARGVLAGAGAAVDGLSNSTQAGVTFVFGFLAGGGSQPYAVTNPGGLFVFAFRVLPVILVICALSALLWHWRILKWITQAFGLLFERTMGLRGPPALATAATVFMGQVEGPIFIRSYLAALSRSELFMLLAVGMSCVSGSTMVAYATILKGVLPNAAAHVLTASIISAPAGVLLARILVPRDVAAESTPDDRLTTDKVYESSIDALIRGTSDGLQIVLNIAATLIVFVSLVAMVDGLLGLLAPVGGSPLSLERGLGLVFAPLAWCLGVPWKRGRGAAGLAARREADAHRIHRLHRPGQARPRRRLRSHPHDHDLRALRLRQHRLGGNQCRRLLGAGPGAAQGGDGHGLESDDGRLPRHLHDRFGGRRHAVGPLRQIGSYFATPRKGTAP